MIYANFERVLVSQDNGKQNPDESYMKKFQKHIACSHGYKLVRADDSKHFKSYLVEDSAYNFITRMLEERKYCSDLMEKDFNKELVTTRKR